MLAVLNRLTTRLFAYPAVLLVLAMLFWSGNTVAGRLAVGHISPFSLVSFRWILVIAVLWPIYGGEVRQHWPQIRDRWGWLLLMAGCGFTIFNVMFYFAAYSTSAVNIGILQGSMPIFVLAGAFVLYGARASAVQCVGAAVTAFGVLMVATQGAPFSIFQLAVGRGDLLMLAACVLYSLYTLGLRSRPQMSGTAFFTLLAGLAALTSIPLLVIEAFTTGIAMPSLQGLLVASYVAVFPSCISQLFFLRGVDLMGPSRAGIFMNLVPIFSALLGVSLLGEPFRWFHAVAIVLVIGGIWLAEHAPKAWRGGT